jgi:hypothetical protein
MPPQRLTAKLTVEEIARRFHGDMIPLGGKFSYFTAMPVLKRT